MPTLTPIPNPSGWLSTLLSRLGINRLKDFLLSDVVSPVALVDSYVSLTANTVPPLFGTPASAGEIGGPAANTRLADTGALPAGTYTFRVIGSHNENVTASFRVRRRNAADAADVWSIRIAIVTAAIDLEFRQTLAANERIVFENVGAGGGGFTYQGAIFAAVS